MSKQTWSFEHLGSSHWKYIDFDGPATLKGPGVEELVDGDNDDSVDAWMVFLVVEYNMPARMIGQVHAKLTAADKCRKHDNSKFFRVEISLEGDDWVIEQVEVDLA